MTAARAGVASLAAAVLLSVSWAAGDGIADGRIVAIPALAAAGVWLMDRGVAR